MISKRIQAKQGSGFRRLAAYVVNVQAEHQGADPASWTRLSAYVLDVEHEGEKVAYARASNCGTDDLGWAVKAILATQARNTRSQGDKSYHLVVSFPEGEKPSREQIEDIEDRLCDAIGFADHQRVSAVHQNTDNWHLHVAINKVHPTTLRNVSPHRDFYRLQATCAEMEVKHGLTQEPHTVDFAQSRERKAHGRADEFEASHGGQSFGAWVSENAKSAILTARDSGKGWPEVNRVAAEFDLVIKLHGAGLVIGHRGDARLHVKASAIDRGLSMKVMVDALGPFVPGAAQERGTGGAQGEPVAPGARQSYRRPRPAGSLWEQYCGERATAEAARKAALDQLRAAHLNHHHKLTEYHQRRLRHERVVHLPGAMRRESLQHVLDQQQADRRENRERERRERQATRETNPVQTWNAFLEREAAAGNVEALETLRRQRQRQTKLAHQIIAAANQAEVRHIIFAHMRPSVRRDGRLIYRLDDGGLVSDEAAHVRVPAASLGASALALDLAAKRFGRAPLMVQGTDDFRRQVAELAGSKGMSVRFADPALERQRIASRGQRAGLDPGVGR